MKIIKNKGSVYLWETEDRYEVEYQGPGQFHSATMSREEAEAEFDIIVQEDEVWRQKK